VDAVVAALEGRGDGEICFCEAQTVSEISPEASRFGTVEASEGFLLVTRESEEKADHPPREG
jgi:hypothetical protein